MYLTIDQVALLLCFLFEICIDGRLTSLFNFDDVQYGFVAKKGCQAALVTVNTIIDYLFLSIEVTQYI